MIDMQIPLCIARGNPPIPGCGAAGKVVLPVAAKGISDHGAMGVYPVDRNASSPRPCAGVHGPSRADSVGWAERWTPAQGRGDGDRTGRQFEPSATAAGMAVNSSA